MLYRLYFSMAQIYCQFFYPLLQPVGDVAEHGQVYKRVYAPLPFLA